MIRYSIVLAAFLLLGCGKDKEILLPKSNKTIVKDVADISPIYFLFQEKDKDTLVEVDKQTIISTTNWIFNIDKRFPMRKILPEVIRLQNRKGSHQGEVKVENYYSYADSIGKNMAFVPFTNVVYTLGKQKDFADQGKVSLVLKLDKHNKITGNGVPMALAEFPRTVTELYPNQAVVVFLHFDQNLPYQDYIAAKVVISGWKLQNVEISNKEYCY